MKSPPYKVFKMIREAKDLGLTELDLSFNLVRIGAKLSRIPDEVFELTRLTRLSLSVNSIDFIPDKISQLKNLTHLDLSSNNLATLPDSIAQLQNLTYLNLSDNNFASLPEAISKLRNLRVLSLPELPYSAIPEWISELQNLTTLVIADSRFNVIPEQILKLENLRDLHIIARRLETLPDWIGELKHLTNLMLLSAGLTALPDSFAQLKQLKTLTLYCDALTAIPEVIYEITSLEGLSLIQSTRRESGGIKEISPKIIKLENLQRLLLTGLEMEKPPPEIINLGNYAEADVDKIKNYFRQLEAEGTDHLYEAKLLIVGEPGAGKSTLMKKILDPAYQLREDEKSTEGIEVRQWHFPMENGQQFRVNVWDFGGQEIYHATHQYFLTKRSLYALVADTRKEDTDFYYWLNVVEQLSDNSPLLIVKNEKQDRYREINERQLRGQFENLTKTLATNLADNRGLPQILSEIKHQICGLPHIGTPLPKTWVKVRETLESDPRNHIPLEEYLRICGQHGFKSKEDKLQLSEYLHDLGVFLHFQKDELLLKTVILKPKWGTDAAYKVLDDRTVIRQQGKFNQSDLANIWSDEEYADMQGELLRLMINFKLCYRMKGSDDYIAPQRLTENQPDYEWDAGDNLILRYTYESFMPKGILTQFIVAMQQLIADQRYVWKSGVILEKDRTKAEVIESQDKREIKIRVAGLHKKELMTIVTYELDAIHASYKRLNYSKLIPCNCAKCKHNQEPNFYEFETVRQFVLDKKLIQCQKSYEMVSALSLIDDVMGKDKFLAEEVMKELGDITFRGPHYGDVIIQQARTGGDIMTRSREREIKARSAWANGSFYLFLFVVVIFGVGFLASTVPFYTLAAVLVAGILFVPIIGALQLRQDNRLSEKSFVELMQLTIGQLPLIGKVAGPERKSIGEGNDERRNDER